MLLAYGGFICRRAQPSGAESQGQTNFVAPPMRDVRRKDSNHCRGRLRSMECRPDEFDSELSRHRCERCNGLGRRRTGRWREVVSFRGPADGPYKSFKVTVHGYREYPASR